MATEKSPTPVKKPITPWTFKDEGLRSAMIDHLKSFTPDGNPDPSQLTSARAFAIAEIAALPESINFVAVSIEANASERGRQVNVIVVAKTIRA
jgi:hypothetical protein